MSIYKITTLGEQPEFTDHMNNARRTVKHNTEEGKTSDFETINPLKELNIYGRQVAAYQKLLLKIAMWVSDEGNRQLSPLPPLMSHEADLLDAILPRDHEWIVDQVEVVHYEESYA